VVFVVVVPPQGVGVTVTTSLFCASIFACSAIVSNGLATFACGTTVGLAALIYASTIVWSVYHLAISCL